MAGIRLENLRKEFGRVVAVEDLTLTIPHGAFVALLGPSGCGKSTTMNMISGLERPTRGEVYFDSTRMTDVPPGKRNIGFVFQNYAIFTHMSVADNIGFGLKVRGVPRAEIERRVREVADLLQIGHMLRMNAGRLSVNDMQKVALGRSMIIKPSIFLLDEPFSNLDAAFRAYMRAELKRLQRELKQTMIYVTHDQVEAMSMADLIAVMDFGVLQQVGTPLEIYDRPINRFVANFIGSPHMNFVACRYEHAGERGYLTGGELGAARVDVTPLRPAIEAGLNPDRRAIFGVRPEQITVHETPQPEALAGEVLLIEPLGPKTVVHVKVGEAHVQAIAPHDYRPRIGATRWLTFPPGAVHVFDGISERALR